ncbi:TPA_asm: hypothetical protein G4J86_001624 [Salmonella enterica subsp. enterica serovar Derby]|nr:hypothetical protein [Salmonella enterica subsp. enterica serovar Derby]
MISTVSLFWALCVVCIVNMARYFSSLRALLVVPRFYVSTSKSIIKALINMHSFEIQLSPIG